MNRSATIAPAAQAHADERAATILRPASYVIDGRTIALAACIVAFALRLFLLDAKSIWLDEVLTINTVADGQARLWAGRSDRDHPPLYFWIMEQAAYLGDSPFALRLPAALSGALSVPLAFALARLLFGSSVALTAAWLTALSPLLIWYAQETRSYSALACLGLVSMTGCAMLQVHPRPLPRFLAWLLFVTGSVLALYTHYAALLLIPVQLALFVALWSGKRTNLWSPAWIVAGWIVAFVAFLPWLRSPAMVDFLAGLQGDRTYYAQIVAQRTGLSLSALFVPILVALPLLMALALLPIYLFFRRQRPWLNSLRANPLFQAVALLLFLAILFLSAYPRGHSLKRQLLILWPSVIVLIAWCWPWRAQFRRSLQWLLLASGIAALITIVAVPKDQWREATAYIALNAGPGDAMTTLPSYQVIPFDYYNRGRVPTFTVSGNQAGEQLAQARDQYERLWVAFHTTDRAGPRTEVERWLGEHGTLVEQRSFYHIDLHLYRFERP